MKRHSIAAAILLAASVPAQAQQDNITWTQTLNIPKGQNLPRDRADILGIEIGDTYAEAKAKLEKLATEGIQPKPQSTDIADRMAARMDGAETRPPYSEERQIFRVPIPGASTVVTASYVAKLSLTRRMPGGASPISEGITVNLSAPSSGHQVVSIGRSITYQADADQPLVSELLGQMEAKLRTKPQVFQLGETTVYKFQFNDGQPYVPRNAVPTSCTASAGVLFANAVPSINASGDCDAVMQVTVNYGISRNHARSIGFTLGDNERVKANAAADFAFISDYVRNLQLNTRGAPPNSRPCTQLRAAVLARHDPLVSI